MKTKVIRDSRGTVKLSAADEVHGNKNDPSIFLKIQYCGG